MKAKFFSIHRGTGLFAVFGFMMLSPSTYAQDIDTHPVPMNFLCPATHEYEEPYDYNAAIPVLTYLWSLDRDEVELGAGSCQDFKTEITFEDGSKQIRTSRIERCAGFRATYLASYQKKPGLRCKPEAELFYDQDLMNYLNGQCDYRSFDAAPAEISLHGSCRPAPSAIDDCQYQQSLDVKRQAERWFSETLASHPKEVTVPAACCRRKTTDEFPEPTAPVS